MPGMGSRELCFVWNVKLRWILLLCKRRIGQMRLTRHTKSFLVPSLRRIDP